MCPNIVHFNIVLRHSGVVYSYVVYMVPLKCNVALAQQHVARCMLEFEFYHLKYASLQLKNRSTLGLQQNFYIQGYLT